MVVAVGLAELIGSRSAAIGSIVLTPVKTIAFVHGLRILGVAAIDVVKAITDRAGAKLTGANDLGSFSNIIVFGVVIRLLESLHLAEQVCSGFATFCGPILAPVQTVAVQGRLIKAFG